MRSMSACLRRRAVKAVLSATPAAGVVLGLALSGSAHSQTGATVMPDKNGFIPRASIIEIMDSMVMSTADVLWNAVGVSVTEAGIIENKPETDEDWARLRWAAVTMAEATNALVIPGRHVAPPGMALPEPDPNDPSLQPPQIEALIKENWAAWVGHAHVLDAAALQAIQAIDAQDVDKLTDVGGTIDAACESCHLQFWYPEPQ